MNSLDSDPFHGVLHWHRFDQRMTDEELADALESIGVMAIMIDRKQRVVFVDKDNSFTPEIQKLLNNWSPQ
jgi:protein-L-isoaspartate O-methyltransferase